MCLSPIRIRNPNLNKYSRNNKILKQVSDCESQFINVPCNHCSVCIALRQNYFCQRVQMESLDNVIYFFTFTYKPDYLPSLVVKGRQIDCHDIKDLQNLFKRVRKNYDLPKFRYVITSEFGSRLHRPHYHGLLFFPYSSFTCVNGIPNFSDLLGFERKLNDILLSEWCINLGSNRSPDYKPLCDFHKNGRFRNFDCQLVDTFHNTEHNVSFYVSKYMCKYDKYVDSIRLWLWHNCDSEEEYYTFWNRFKPKFLYSKNFGNPESDKVKTKIREDIDISISAKLPYPCFFDSFTGKSFPLSPYYRKRYMDYLDSLIFSSYSDSLSDFSRVIEFDKDIDDSIKLAKQFDDNMSFLNSNTNDLDYLIYG